MTIENCKFAPISENLLPKNGITDENGQIIYSYDEYKEYGASLYFNGAGNNDTISITNNLFLYSGISFDSTSSGEFVIKQNIFQGEKNWNNHPNYTYSTIGFISWSNPPVTEFSSNVTVKKNQFLNSGKINFSKVTNGFLDVSENYWGTSTPYFDGLIDVPDTVLIELYPYYTDETMEDLSYESPLILVEKETVNLIQGKSLTLQYQLSENVEIVTEWASNQEKIATVTDHHDGSITIKAIRSGTAKISVTVARGEEISTATIVVKVTNSSSGDGKPNSPGQIIVKPDFSKPSAPNNTGNAWDGETTGETGGALYLDTLTYTFAPEHIYDIKMLLLGANTGQMEIYSSRPGIASVKPIGNGKYRVTGISEGETFIMFKVYRDGIKMNHASVKVTVKEKSSPFGTSNKAASLF